MSCWDKEHKLRKALSPDIDQHKTFLRMAGKREMNYEYTKTTFITCKFSTKMKVILC